MEEDDENEKGRNKTQYRWLDINSDSKNKTWRPRCGQYFAMLPQEQTRWMVEVLHLLLGPHRWKPPVFKPCSLCEHRYNASYDQQHRHPSFPVHDRGKSKYSAMYLEETNVLQVVSGSLTFYVFDATSQPLVGCSGGVYCLVGTILY